MNSAADRQYQLDITKKLFTGQEVPNDPAWNAIGGFAGEPAASEATSHVPLESADGGSLHFSHDWNAKLSCQAFTTFRMFNPRKFRKGALYKITLARHGDIGIARLVDLLTLRYSEITPAIAYIDTGYDLETFRSIIRKMYQEKVADFRKSLWNLLVLKWEVRT